MASQNLNVGTAANANDGDTLRAAFIKVKQMFAEVYGQTYSEQGDLSGVTFEIKEDKLKATNTAVDGYVLTYDSGTGGFTWEQKFDGDITSIVAGAGLTGTSLDTDDATLNVIGGDGITVNADEVEATVDGATIELSATDGTGALRVKDDGIDYDKLAGEFTTSSALTAATDLDIDFSTAAVFTTTSAIAMDLNFTNAEIGQVKTIIVTDSGGTSSLTFDTGANTVTTLNGTYDATAGAVNVIQVICTASNTFFVTISQ